MESKKDDESRSLLPSQHSDILTDDKKKNNESLSIASNNESPFQADDSKTTYMTSLMAFLRTLVGTGVLSLPIALKYTGLALGPILMVFTALLNYAAMHLILNMASRLSAKLGRKIPRDLQLPEVAYFTFSISSSKAIRKLAFIIRCVVAFSVVILHILVCAIYHLFVAANLRRFVINLVPLEDSEKVPSLLAFEVGLLALFLPYVFVRRIDLLGKFFTMGNILAATSLTLIITYCLIDLPKWIKDRQYPLFSSMDTIPIGFGIIIFAFEGMQLLLSIRNRMVDQNLMSTKWGVLNVSLLIATIFYLSIGSLGYLRFGDSVERTITLNMPRDQPIFYIAAPLYAIAIFISYGLFFYLIAVIVIESLCLSDTITGSPNVMLAIDALIRVTFVLLIFACAVLVPYIDLMVAMTGSLAGAFLCFTLPAVIHAVSLTWAGDDSESEPVGATGSSSGEKQNEPSGAKGGTTFGSAPLSSSAALFVDVVLIVVGTIAGTLGTYATVSSIIREKLKA